MEDGWRRKSRKKRHEVLRYTDRSDSWASAAVRDAKGLVQIQMANIGADVAGPAEAHLRVHVCAVHINLAAMRMNDFANLADGRFENSVG